MPFAKKTYAKKRAPYKRKGKGVSWYNRKYSAVQLAQKALKQIWEMKGMINSERKVLNGANNAVIPNTGSVFPISTVPQGDTEVTRDGNSIFVRSIMIRSLITQHASATGTIVRVILFQDSDPNPSAVPTAADVLTTTGSAYAPLSNLDRDTSLGRFKILKSWMVNLDAGQTSASIKHYADVRTHCRFDGPLGTDVRKNALYILFISNEPTNTPTDLTVSRITYYDN